ncbi:MAG: helix-turn-helix transcriptional regulator [Pseudomonadota bacterium]
MTIQRDMALADRIKKARILAGLSQAELARRCGVSPSLLCNLENGKIKSLRHSMLLQMAKILGKSPEWLAFGRGHAKTSSTRLKSEHDFLADFHKLSATERKIVARMVHGLVMDKS